MAEIETDTLSIDIESEASGSINNKIDEIISKLQGLGEKLKTSTSNLDKFKSKFTELTNIKMPDFSSQFSKLSDFVSKKFISEDKPKSPLSEIAKPDTSYKDTKAPDISKGDTSGLDEIKKKSDDAKKSLSSLKNTSDSTSKSIKKVGSSSSGNFSGLKKAFSEAEKSARKMGDSIKKSFSKSIQNSIKKFGLAMLGVRSAFAAIRKAVSAYMEYDTSLGEELQNNWAVLGSLLAPILEQIIHLFSIAVSYIRAFVKALTGIDLVARANSKAMKNLNKSIKDTLGNVAKFDELNTVDFGKNKSSANELPQLNTLNVDTSWIDDLIRRLKSGDWYGIGMEIGRMLNEGLRKINIDWFIEKAKQWGKNIADLMNGLTDGIDWNLVGEKFAGGLNTIIAFGNSFFERYNFDHLGTALATGLNSMISNVDWEGLGSLFGNKVQALIDLLYNFINTFDFENFGSSLSTSFNSAVEKVDLGKAGETLADGIAGVFEFLSTTITTIDWAQLGTKISDFFVDGLHELNKKIEEIDWYQLGKDIWDALVDFVTNIDWNGFAQELATLLGEAIAGLGLFMAGFIQDAVNGIADYFSQFIDEDADWQENGRNIIKGVLKGILDGVVGIGEWLYNNVFVPFIDGFKSMFDINSPSKVMETYGEYIIDGLFNGIKGLWETVEGIFEEFETNIGTKITNIKDNISTGFSDAWDNIKATFSYDNVNDHFEDVKTTISDKFEETKTNIETFLGDAWTTVKTIWGQTPIGQLFSNVRSEAEGKFSDIGETAGNIVGNALKGIINSVLTVIENKINSFIRQINKAIDVVNKLPIKSKLSKLDEITIPKLATGTNKIEAEGLYHLHEGEAVVPKKYNPAVNDEVYKPDNSELISEIKSLRQTLSTIEQHTTINLGNKTLMKETRKLIKDENDVYGERVYNF